MLSLVYYEICLKKVCEKYLSIRSSNIFVSARMLYKNEGVKSTDPCSFGLTVIVATHYWVDSNCMIHLTMLTEPSLSI